MDDEKDRVYESVSGSDFESIENGLISLTPLEDRIERRKVSLIKLKGLGI